MTTPLEHAVVIPLHGRLPDDLEDYLLGLRGAGLQLVLVDNREAMARSTLLAGLPLLAHHNRGGLAGGLNRGVAVARDAGAAVITLLDQDSRLPAADLHALRRFLLAEHGAGGSPRVVGPAIWDADRGRWHAPRRPARQPQGWTATRMMITSGTTLRSADWPQLGAFDTWMEIDYIDHDWCFRAVANGFQLVQLHACTLRQHFGSPHPSAICRALGMQLYPPQRHYTALRNLRLLARRSYVPPGVKLRELIRMLIKPLAWLLFEPQRRANFRAIRHALSTPLPVTR